jgi:hypothetical protein
MLMLLALLQRHLLILLLAVHLDRDVQAPLQRLVILRLLAVSQDSHVQHLGVTIRQHGSQSQMQMMEAIGQMVGHGLDGTGISGMDGPEPSGLHSPLRSRMIQVWTAQFQMILGVVL